jgi:hypothetical protein
MAKREEGPERRAKVRADRAQAHRHGLRRRGLTGRTLFVLAVLLGAPMLGAPVAWAAAEKPDWDQVANIKDAATRLAQMQRRQGAKRAFAFIDACYRTHSLSSKYTKAFEACIAQDYLETQVLAMIYSRLQPTTFPSSA